MCRERRARAPAVASAPEASRGPSFRQGPREDRGRAGTGGAECGRERVQRPCSARARCRSGGCASALRCARAREHTRCRARKAARPEGRACAARRPAGAHAPSPRERLALHSIQRWEGRRTGERLRPPPVAGRTRNVPLTAARARSSGAAARKARHPPRRRAPCLLWHLRRDA